MQETTNLETNNEVTLVGKITQDAEFSHESYGEKFFKTFLSIPRTSGYEDVIPVVVSERLLDPANLTIGTVLTVVGQIRTFNKPIGDDSGKTKLVVSVFAREIYIVTDEDYVPQNNVKLVGYICKKPTYRKTPQGREICDLLLAVNRAYKKSDYIPSLTWGRNASFSADLIVGDKLTVTGRIQSREYNKRLSETESEVRVAYEVSINQIVDVDYAPEKSEVEEDDR